MNEHKPPKGSPMRTEPLKLWTAAIVAGFLLGSLALPEAPSDDITGLWKTEYGIKDGGDGERMDAPERYYFYIKEDGSFLLNRRPDKGKVWEREDDKIHIYFREEKEHKDDTWVIQKLTEDSLIVLSTDNNRITALSSSDKSFEEVAQ